MLDGSGKVELGQDSSSYAFVIYGIQDRACVYMGYSAWHSPRGTYTALLAGRLVCERR
jgi:hypothetical protein